MEKYNVVEVRIGRRPDTEKLYKLEKRRNDAIQKCAEEWQRLMGNNIRKDYPFFEVALPTAFYDMMDAYDTEAGICASKLFLEKNGHEVRKVKP